MRRKVIVLCLMIVPLMCIPGCSGNRVRRTTYPATAAETIDNKYETLKAHLRNGDVAIFSNWYVDPNRHMVHGTTTRLDVNRQLLGTGIDSIAIDSVALFETTDTHPPPLILGMTLMSAFSAYVTIYCIIYPKSCFGSCPTFYVDDGSRMSLQAEGFSSSIAPSLEATDLDALWMAHPRSREFTITMKNEALETHVVRHVDLLAVERPQNGRVLATSAGRFFRVHSLRPPSSCIASEGECLASLSALDSLERFSFADSLDLAEREMIDVQFDSLDTSTSYGLAVGFRESLMTTYLFYQSLAYLGTNAGAFLAQGERDHEKFKASLGAMWKVLGGIEVYVQNRAGEWVTAGTIDESGPIATNIQLLPLPHDLPPSPRIRLRMAKGLWRLNWLALCSLDGEAKGIRLAPQEVHRSDTLDATALESLLDPSKSLVTLPGDSYSIRYELPERYDRYELFLESRGYYIEWMREEWLAEENAMQVMLMLGSPAAYLRQEAPRYKQIEPQIEQQFWSSRYVRP